MWVVKWGPGLGLDALLARMLAIERGETVALEAPRSGAPAGVRLRSESAVGYIHCAVQEFDLALLRDTLEDALRASETAHLARRAVESTAGTVTVRAFPPERARRVVLAPYEEKSPSFAFTWVLSSVNESLFYQNLFYSMQQVERALGSVLLDGAEDSLFSYEDGAFVERVSASKMVSPVLPEPLRAASQELDGSCISLLVDQDTCQLEFMDRAVAKLCARLQSDELAPADDVSWRRVQGKIVCQTACERDCYLCRMPVRDYGLVVHSARMVRDEVPEPLINVYCTHVDPLLALFADHCDKYALVCKHCVRVVENVSADGDALPVRLEYRCVYFDEHSYARVCAQSPALGRYAFMLDSVEIGRESRAIKVNNQFYIADRGVGDALLLREPSVRASKLPLMHVSLLFYNRVCGYY